VNRDSLKAAVKSALKALGGSAPIIGVAKELWRQNEADLKDSGDLFFTWQYDMRWAAQELQKDGQLAIDKNGSHSIWRLL